MEQAGHTRRTSGIRPGYRPLGTLTLAAATLSVSATAQTPATPALAGDRPDPTVLRVGGEYWTASTSGDWAPIFSLARSRDLVHWQAAGAVFQGAPAWARGDFWAPELARGPLGFYVFYAARKVDGPLCVAVATAPSPAGPYTDHGPLLCQPDGAIDPSVVIDEGRPYLVWKEDGNSVKAPSILWAKALSKDWLQTEGDAFELLRNDPLSWEGSVIEGPFLVHHAGSLFLFYAGNACCGVDCHYAEGVARAEHLHGPWTRDPLNPVIRPNGVWRCPGHGTAVAAADGKDYLLYHAYPAQGFAYVGRESVLDEITWSSDGWPVINGGRGPSGSPLAAPPPEVHEQFAGRALDPDWKWPLGAAPSYTLRNYTLTLHTAPGRNAFVAHSLPTFPFTATVLLPAGSTTAAGIGIVGESGRMLTLFWRGDMLSLEKQRDGRTEVLSTKTVAAPGALWLQIEANSSRDIAFRFSSDRVHWKPAGATLLAPDILAWDRGMRVALVASGSSREGSALFQRVSIVGTRGNK